MMYKKTKLYGFFYTLEKKSLRTAFVLLIKRINIYINNPNETVLKGFKPKP